MSDNGPRPENTPYEKAARITYLLCAVGIAMTTAEVAEEAELSHRGALYLLEAISRKCPIYQDELHIWRKLVR